MVILDFDFVAGDEVSYFFFRRKNLREKRFGVELVHLGWTEKVAFSNLTIIIKCNFISGLK